MPFRKLDSRITIYSFMDFRHQLPASCTGYAGSVPNFCNVTRITMQKNAHPPSALAGAWTIRNISCITKGLARRIVNCAINLPIEKKSVAQMWDYLGAGNDERAAPLPQ
jgi:hypothetical protein